MYLKLSYLHFSFLKFRNIGNSLKTHFIVMVLVTSSLIYLQYKIPLKIYLLLCLPVSLVGTGYWYRMDYLGLLLTAVHLVAGIGDGEGDHPGTVPRSRNRPCKLTFSLRPSPQITLSEVN